MVVIFTVIKQFKNACVIWIASSVQIQKQGF